VGDVTGSGGSETAAGASVVLLVLGADGSCVRVEGRCTGAGGAATGAGGRLARAVAGGFCAWTPSAARASTSPRPASASGRAVLSIRSRTFSRLRFGSWPSSSAAMPATCGAAMEVPAATE
jgi:hypothetical protein